MEWSYSTYSGFLSEVGSTGVYIANIGTTDFGAGTRVLTITAEKSNFVTSITTVTLVILYLNSEVIPEIPSADTAVLEVNRGDGVPMRVWLNDTYSGALITNDDVTRVYITFNGTQYDMVWNATEQNYVGLLPGSATLLLPGSYDVRITATFPNYNPSTYSFKILILQTSTRLDVLRRLPDGSFVPLSKISAVYSEIVTFYVNFTAPSLSYAEQNISAAFINWLSEEWSINVNFTHFSGGMFMYVFDTRDGTWGTTGLTFRGYPDDPVLASASKSITITISEIETEVLTEYLSFSEHWGWIGNLTFFYNDTSFNAGIETAVVTYQYGGLDYMAVDIGGGYYQAFVNTTLLTADTRYSIFVTFARENYEERRFQVEFFVEERPVEISVIIPEQNWKNIDTALMQVPMGDILNVTFFYNDTSSIGGLSGGILNASLGDDSRYVAFSYFASYKNITLYELGGGYYYFLFDTNDLSLYQNLDFIKTIIPGERFRFTIEFISANREDRITNFNIEIVPITTEIDYDMDTEIELENGQDYVFDFTITDTWHGTVVDDFRFDIEAGQNVRIISNESLGSGQYRLVVRADGYGGDYEVRIVLSREFYESVEFEMTITGTPNQMDVLFTQIREVYLPIGLVVALFIGFYVRVWSVPKKIRQMNGQIKALNKGKMPKPIQDAKSRQTLIAELFNDTQSALKITRTPDQMPVESVPIEVPEMGELLVQLAILTHLDADELEEFKADIAKMKISEQAAFVKEVIMQEAIRAARRDGKTIEETLAEVERAATLRLGGEEAAAKEKEPEVETVFLKSDTEPKEKIPDFTEPEEVITEKETRDPTPMSEKMSDYEIEELRRDLERKGVPPYEIDNIVEQARTLPRDLVEELVRSLGIDRE